MKKILYDFQPWVLNMKLLYTIQRYDISIFMRFVNVCLYEPLYYLCRLISKTGDGFLYVVIVIAVIWQAGIGNAFVQVVLAAFLLERPLYFVLKNSLKRNRPQAALNNFQSFIVPSDQFSFPSGHTSAAFMMATLGGEFWPVLALPLYGWSICIGFSRVLLGVHFPSDVVIGAAMGTGIAYLSLYLLAL
ncbi:Phosphoesterase PA-phosphatase related protein [Crenothrix polyspora]|uniref:undecaprenyl-diphosphate phosphatase n=2 Tax=Crenothrix polyspora TaxID=360316 RepID=A0A1R4HC29_9GAMM|nr:Phosphoesterase PA-phosphatase related protein [Crenothrix polyspora]